MRILVSAATALTILGIALLLLLTPVWTHFALGATGSTTPDGGGQAALAASDQTISDLLFLGDFALTTADGSQFYTEDEISHLRDARTLLYAFLGLATVSLVFVVVVLGRAPRDVARWRAVARGGLGLAIGLVVVGIFAAVAFDAAFTLFHTIFFPGGNWAFPADSNMIRLYPEAFFEMTAFALGALAITGGLLTWLLARTRARTLEAK